MDFESAQELACRVQTDGFSYMSYEVAERFYTQNVRINIK